MFPFMGLRLNNRIDFCVGKCGTMVNLYLCFVLSVLTFNPDAGMAPAFVDRSQDIPDYCQTTPKDSFQIMAHIFVDPLLCRIR